MKVYTKKGDKGSTQLIGGRRVAKSHLRIEAYGTIDELNSYVGLLRDLVTIKDKINLLLEIQDRLFTIGSLLANDGIEDPMNLPKISESDIFVLEKDIDKMNDVLPEMRNFVLPGGNIIVSNTHITRSICRRAERLVVQLPDETLQKAMIIKYLNRLSDYFFVLSRFLSKELNATEIIWKPRVN